MTGRSHVVVNSAVAYAIFGNPTIAIAAAICAKLPDQMERFLPGVKHRGVTHVMIFWGVLALFLFGGVEFPHLLLYRWDSDPTIAMALFGIAFGGLLHVAADFFSISGVPILPACPAFGMKWYKTGSISEYLILACVILACVTTVAVKYRCLGPLLARLFPDSAISGILNH